MSVRESILDLATPTGPMRTAVFAPVTPDGATRHVGGLVLYSEIFQLTAPVRRLAVQVAGLGYLVMTPEIYHTHEPPGTVLNYDEAGKARSNALKQELSLTAFDADARAVLAALRDHPACNGRVGTFGICLGGHLAFRAALQPDVAVAACFYPTDLHSGTLGRGGGADTLARAAELHGELLLVFGRQNPTFRGMGGRAFTPRWIRRVRASPGTSSTLRTPLCATKGSATIPQRRGWPYRWLPTCLGER